MANKELIEEVKDELLEMAAENGSLVTDDIFAKARANGLDWEAVRGIMADLQDQGIEILGPEEVYLRGLHSARAKVNFCYFLFICYFLDRQPEVDKYNRELVFRQRNAVDHYLSSVLNKEQLSIARALYGLENGEPCYDREELFHRFGNNDFNTFIDDFTKVNRTMYSDFEEYVYLARELKAIAEQYAIDHYEIHEESNDEGVAFDVSPYAKEKDKPTVSGLNFGFYRYENPHDREIDLGWRGDDGRYIHWLGLFKTGDWTFFYPNGDKETRNIIPDLSIQYDEGKLCFLTLFGGQTRGFHGRTYEISDGGNTVVREYQKGKLVSEYEIEFGVDVDLSHLFSLQEFDSGNMERMITDEGDIVFQSEGSYGGRNLVCQYEINGSCIGGQRSESGFEGTVLRHPAWSNTFVYTNYCNGQEDENGPQIVVHQKRCYPPEVILQLRTRKGRQCKFIYRPESVSEQLLYFEADATGKETARFRNLSNPFEKKLPVVSHDQDPIDPRDALNNLIGLTEVKEEIARLTALIKKENAKKNLPNLNMAFLGNPGTGKTVVARLLAGILHKEGILPTRNCIEVDRSMIVGRYIGDTENNVRELIEKAVGGVLFVDEAYSLFTGRDDGKDFGSRAIDVFVKAMEDHRGKICFIFAGYPQEMANMIFSNPGFQSRINHVINFPDYTPEELKRIAEMLASDKGYLLGEGVADEIVEIVKAQMDLPGYANAREVRNQLESVESFQAIRTKDDPNDLMLTMDDVLAYEKKTNFVKPSAGVESPTFDLSGLFKSIKDDVLKEAPTVDNQTIQEASVNIQILENGKIFAEGSGFFISSDGFIATCAHVIRDAKTVQVNVNIFTNKGKKITKRYDATVVGFSDAERDVGLLKIDNPDMEFSYYRLADPFKELEPLSTVVMGGYPLGKERFANISINEGKIQAINKDQLGEDEPSGIDYVFLDLSGLPGSSGSGIVERSTNKCVAVYAGRSVEPSREWLGIRRAIPVKYLIELIVSIYEKSSSKTGLAENLIESGSK